MACLRWHSFVDVSWFDDHPEVIAVLPSQRSDFLISQELMLVFIEVGDVLV